MVFFLESAVLGNWIPRIPDIKQTLGLSGFVLGICLFALSAGTMTALLFAGRVTTRYGLRQTLFFSLPLWAVVFVFPGFASNASWLFLSLLVAGLMVGLTEVAMNTVADDIEKGFARRIMSRCHGFWSLGSLFGAACGALFSHAGVSTAVHFTLVMPLIAIAGWYFVSLLPNDAAAAANSTSEPVNEPARKGSTLAIVRERGLLLLCLMPLGIMCVEGIFIDWSALFVRTVLEADAVAIGVVYAFFSSVMALTRMQGDALIERFGPLLVARVSAAAATVGVVLFASSSSLVTALLAAGLSGLGVAIVYPLAMTAAAERPGVAAENVAAVALVGFSAFLLAPPITGMLSDWLGLRWAIGVFAPAAALTGFLAGELVVPVDVPKETDGSAKSGS